MLVGIACVKHFPQSRTSRLAVTSTASRSVPEMLVLGPQTMVSSLRLAGWITSDPLQPELLLDRRGRGPNERYSFSREVLKF